MKRRAIVVALPDRATVGSAIRGCIYELKQLLTDGGKPSTLQLANIFGYDTTFVELIRQVT